jgi:hypothetical protein
VDFTVLLPLGEGGAAAPDEGSPPHDFTDFYRSWGVFPSPGAARHSLPAGEGKASKITQPNPHLAWVASTETFEKSITLKNDSACHESFYDAEVVI